MIVAGAVGWLCQRIGLSLIVGYLLAGAIIGPFTPPFQLVTDLDRVQMLSQVGLVFLIFSIGLDLNFQRLRRLGFSVLLATVLGAILVFHASRLLGVVLDWSHTQSLFLAGMVMVSSSAILSKVLQELNASHERFGQLALGVTVLEDMVAVVMLTLLSTMIQFGGEASPPIAKTIGALTAFMVLLLMASLLFVPRLLLRLTQTGTAEVRTIVVIGILLMLAWLAARAGYSLALGAFLIGVIVGSTPQKPEIERVFEGLRDMFGAVFFVAMGMLVDFSILKEAWLLVLGITVFTFFARTIATSIGLVVAGNSIRDSLRAGMSLTPLGEFSFIIAQMGVAAAVIPPSFYPAAVGASLLTTLAAPFLMRRGGQISQWVDRHLPLFLREWVEFYQSWLHRLDQRQQRNLLWKLTGPRLVQVGVQVLIVTALGLFAQPLHTAVVARLGESWLFPNGTNILFWTAFGLLVLAPLIAIWRNIEAISMIFADSVTRGSRQQNLRSLIETVLRIASALVMVLWLLALLPFQISVLWAFLTVAGILTLVAIIFWRRLVRLHSRLEIELRHQLQTALGPHSGPSLMELLEQRREGWNIHAEEFVLPDFAACVGRTIGELALRKRFGSSVASIDRQGVIITNPGAGTILYPGDKLLLLGNTDQIDDTINQLSVVRTDGAQQEIEEFSLETVSVPADSPRAGKRLTELDPMRQLGVQVAGIQRGSQRILTPTGSDHIEPGDELLVLGTPLQIRQFEEWLKPDPPKELLAAD